MQDAKVMCVMCKAIGNKLPALQQMFGKVSAECENIVDGKITTTKEIEHPYCDIGNDESDHRGPVRLSLE